MRVANSFIATVAFTPTVYCRVWLIACVAVYWNKSSYLLCIFVSYIYLLIEAWWCINASVNWVKIGSSNGSLPACCQSITSTNTDILSIRPLGKIFSEIYIEIQQFPFRKAHLCRKMAICHGFIVLSYIQISSYDTAGPALSWKTRSKLSKSNCIYWNKDRNLFNIKWRNTQICIYTDYYACRYLFNEAIKHIWLNSAMM